MITKLENLPNTNSYISTNFELVSEISGVKNDYCPSQIGAVTGHNRRGANVFSRKFTTPRSMPHTVRSTASECEAREVMASGTSAAP